MVAELVDFKMNSDDKTKALDAAIGQIEKAFGKGSVMKLGQNDSVVDIQSISTGSLGLDIALHLLGVEPSLQAQVLEGLVDATDTLVV